ncbi:hypothetical protein M0R45_030315 [Rubus argutus]|uniref:Zinc finger PMZ-type domain-containing protein n=1 Tax=Rubus argutus TaxID=59490 RepID=A0AAW1WAN6_RUBAR
MAKMWRCFRESGPPPENIPEGCYTMEIFHGGYFDKQLDGTKKYKLARFNKLGGKLYLDGLDQDKISWVEFNNIAWELGYREKPISYHFKVPRTSCNEGWIPINNDADAIEMTKLIPSKKKQISVYITGGGRRKKKDAELDDSRPAEPNWVNPLNNVTPIEKEKMMSAANLVASQINRSYSDKNMSSIKPSVYEDVGIDGVNVIEDADGCGKGSTAMNEGIQSLVGQSCNINNIQGQGGKFGSPKRVKHCAKRTWTPKRNVAVVKDNETTVGKEAYEEPIQEAYTGKNKRRQPSQTGREQPSQTFTAPKKYGKKPKETRYNTRHKGAKKYEAVEDTQDSHESEDDSDFYVDSDYDLQQDDEDDVQFEENVSNPRVMEEFDEMGFKGECSDNGGDSDELDSLCGSDTEEDEDRNPLPKRSRKEVNVKAWNRSVDLKNPRFVVGQAFEDSEILKEGVREFALKNQLGLWFGKNCKEKIEVRCQLGCPFWLYASQIKGEGPTLFIKTLNDQHNCSPVQTSHYLTYNRVATEVVEDLLVDENWSRAGIQNYIKKKFKTILKKFKLDVGVQIISRRKRKAKRMNEGHYIEQYNKLAAYRKELLRSNPGSTVEIKTMMDGDVRRFHRMYIYFAACKEGWNKGCRPLIGLDGCHIKGNHPGQILTAVGIDANNGMYPIAFAIAEVENQETWTWFLEYLMRDFKMVRDRSYTFITDKQKGLGNAITDLFPGAEHRHCVRHLYNNFKSKHAGEGLKQCLWNVARSSTVVWYNTHMEEIKRLSEDAWKWFEDKNLAQWTRSHFRDISKCDILLNNLCESFNSAIIPARDKPIITMLEKIRMDMMVRNANRRVACQRWNDMVGPRIKKILDKVGQRSTDYRSHMDGEFEYQVTGGGPIGSKHAVDLGRHTYTCRRWQLSGMPCVHAIYAIRSKHQEPALYCDDYFMPSMYQESYAPIIHPIAGDEDWEPVDYPIAPPLYKKQTVCKKQGHNRLGCPITKAAKAAAMGEGSSNGGQASKKRKIKQQAKRAPAPKGCTNLKDQIIRSRKKIQATMNNNQGVNANASTSKSVQQLPTQSSQNAAARSAHQCPSQFVQPSQASSEWAGF